MHSKQHNIFCKNIYIKMRGDLIFRCKGQSWPQGWIISSNVTLSYLFIFQGGGLKPVRGRRREAGSGDKRKQKGKRRRSGSQHTPDLLLSFVFPLP